MKYRPKNPINLTLCLAILIFLVLGCDAWATSRGKIINEAGEPIEGAKITIQQGKPNPDAKVILSKKDGTFRVNEHICPMPDCSDEIKIKVSREDYQDYEKILSVAELNGNSELTITLNKN